uniref:Uncharacterized protein n=1 Tax=Anguilla anguilla TaxID=7936 RepID=A0A0E9W6Q4_ANGAN
MYVCLFCTENHFYVSFLIHPVIMSTVILPCSYCNTFICKPRLLIRYHMSGVLQFILYAFYISSSKESSV